MLSQLSVKPAKYKKFIKHNKPKERSCGVATKECRRCGRNRGHIDKYGLDLCRQCFREIATKIGFKKYS
ncbi:30S ribosomal protein S14 [Candidatus Woesearchaeota archaeon]|nr:30S ribosomal protein S14 [Candidatus Woesearchaeota archaeon]